MVYIVLDLENVAGFCFALAHLGLLAFELLCCLLNVVCCYD